MPSAETVQVTIFNQTYSLRSLSGAEHVMEIAHLVDERMKQMASHITTHDVSRIAILVALNIADEMKNLKAQYESEIERLLQGSSVETGVEDNNTRLPEGGRASWFEEIFDADVQPKDRAERLSSKISAKLQALRKNETPEPGIDVSED
jgi:cell division protein ZapA